jgi:hypothetical protein
LEGKKKSVARGPAFYIVHRDNGRGIREAARASPHSKALQVDGKENALIYT